MTLQAEAAAANSRLVGSWSCTGGTPGVDEGCWGEVLAGAKQKIDIENTGDEEREKMLKNSYMILYHTLWW